MMRLRLACIIATLLATGSNAGAGAGPLVLDAGYLQPSGAIMTYYKGADIIDPYFPTKALFTAQDNGMNTNALARGWINWLLARQEPNGLFSRFCRDEDINDYRACLEADADDSMMAMWVELLYRSAPTSGMPVQWKQSVRKSEAQLESLFNPEAGVYFVSETMPVGLLMDNVEIYSSLKRIAKEARRLGEKQQASLFSLKAARLKTGIIKTFWNPDLEAFHASTQPRTEKVFYPDIVGQLMPMLHGFDFTPTESAAQSYTAWMNDHHEEWTGLIGNHFPWGLVAVVAAQHNDVQTASCWVEKVAAERNSSNWDVLDEAAFQSVKLQLQKKWPGDAGSCQEAVS